MLPESGINNGYSEIAMHNWNGLTHEPGVCLPEGAALLGELDRLAALGNGVSRARNLSRIRGLTDFGEAVYAVR